MEAMETDTNSDQVSGFAPWVGGRWVVQKDFRYSKWTSLNGGGVSS